MEDREEKELKLYIADLRKFYRIPKNPDDVPLLCNECDVENFKFACNNDFGYEQIKLSFFGIEEPFHRSSLLGYNSKNGPKWFLVDPTYGQFFTNETFANYMLSNHADFSNKLLEDGYIECTLENMISYADGFASSNAFIKPLNSEIIFDNVYNFLLKNHIIFDRKKKR